MAIALPTIRDTRFIIPDSVATEIFNHRTRLTREGYDISTFACDTCQREAAFNQYSKTLRLLIVTHQPNRNK